MPEAVLVVLPCRHGSTRLEAKHLIPLSNGKTLPQMTYEACLKSKADRIVIATDHQKIKSACQAFGAEVLMTDPQHLSGSDRVAEVSAKLGVSAYPIVLNIQGDEPLVDPRTVDALIDAARRVNRQETPLCTAMTHFTSPEAIQSPNNVKVVVEKDSVIGMGVFIGQSTKIYDRATGKIYQGRVPSGSVVLSGSLPSEDGTHSLNTAIIVKRVDAQTRAKTSVNELLRG